MQIDGFSWSLLGSAGGIALIHTVLGPDHYLPFVMLARARRWSRSRTALVTLVCGLGHVASCLALAMAGIAAGARWAGLHSFESARGDLAAWGLVAFGVAYGVWGIRRAVRRSRGLELHEHGGVVHIHGHSTPAHHHAGDTAASSSTFWVLFAVFVLGPCEPLLPLVVLPASRGRWGLALVTAALFGLVTVAAMVALALLGQSGLQRISWGFMERWAHALAGVVIAASGAAILALGL